MHNSKLLIMMNEKAQEIDFETAMRALEKIVLQLESGSLPLERALQLWEEGVALSHRCETQLQAAERKVELLLNKRGELKTTPFKPENKPENKVDSVDTKRVEKSKDDDAVPF